MGMKHVFWGKKSKWPTQKNEFFKIANSQYFFVKISWIGFGLVELKNVHSTQQQKD